MRAALLALALASVAGCSRAPRGGERESTPVLEHRGGTVALDAAVDAVAADPACVDDCVRRRQMEAVSIEHIRATCAAQCSQRALPPP